MIINGVFLGVITHLLTIDPFFLGHPSRSLRLHKAKGILYHLGTWDGFVNNRSMSRSIPESDLFINTIDSLSNLTSTKTLPTQPMGQFVDILFFCTRDWYTSLHFPYKSTSCRVSLISYMNPIWDTINKTSQNMEKLCTIHRLSFHAFDNSQLGSEMIPRKIFLNALGIQGKHAKRNPR